MGNNIPAMGSAFGTEQQHFNNFWKIVWGWFCSACGILLEDRLGLVLQRLRDQEDTIKGGDSIFIALGVSGMLRIALNVLVALILIVVASTQPLGYNGQFRCSIAATLTELSSTKTRVLRANLQRDNIIFMMHSLRLLCEIYNCTPDP